MKNYWLKKNEKKNKPSILKGFPPSNTVSCTIFIRDCDFVSSSWWGTPVAGELPQGDKTHVMQVKVCPLTGVKHNFKMQEGK